MTADPGLPSTSFIIWCSAFVFLMTPGLGLFYSGLARSKNALSNILICMLAYCIVTVQVIISQSHYVVGSHGFLFGFF